MVTQGTGLPLDVLQQEHGAQMVYRVTQQDSRVRLEGRAGARTCLFEAEKPDWAARILLGGGPRYAASTEPAISRMHESNWLGGDGVGKADSSDASVRYF